MIGEDPRAWSNGPRDEKLKAFAKLPTLLGNIADAARSLTEKAEETSALIESMFGATFRDPTGSVAEAETEESPAKGTPIRRSKHRKMGP